MMTMDEIRANAMKAVSVRSKIQSDIIRTIEINQMTRAINNRNREFTAAFIGYATATILMLFCIVL